MTRIRMISTTKSELRLKVYARFVIPTVNPGNRAVGELLHQDLRSFMESILATDADLVINAIRTLVINTLTTHQNGGSLEWQDAELAIYLVFILGDINKSTSRDN
jgi:hypothetical protein